MSWLSNALARVSAKAAASPPLWGGPVGRIPNGTLVLSAEAETVLGLGPAELWRTQPYLRMVVSFMARNVAQLGLHTFRRVSDTDRQRLTDHPAAKLLGAPNPSTTSYELLYQLVNDLALYDRAYWYIGQDADAPSGFTLTRLPPSWVTGTNGGDLFAPESFTVRPTVTHSGTSQTVIAASDVLYFHGWNPDDPRVGTSPVEALKQVLAEQIHASTYRDQTWRRGGRTSSVLQRPADAPEWSGEAKERFRKQWAAQWSGDAGSLAGGTPILEDGMSLQRLGFSANEDQFVDAAKLALNIVAAVYHVNPTMIGLLDNANYSNVREFRRMLYGDTLGPLLAQIEARVNTFLLPRLPDTAGVYAEFNIGEKLQGSFEEQAAALQTAVGRPWMTADEARAKLNMPSLGGDAERLITPLNVAVGGQASPTDSGSQNRASSGAGGVKSRPAAETERRAADQLALFFARQGQIVRTRLGAKADADWWDAARWNRELSAELYAHAHGVSVAAARKTLDDLGVEADRYDVDRTQAYLEAMADGTAISVNATTEQQVKDALDSTDPAQGVLDVFAAAVALRAPQIATTTTTRAASFGTVESARQVVGGKASKTWVTGPKPRKSHAALSGVTVPISEPFPNGLQWPGDGGDAAEVAGCNCGVEINLH